MIASPPKLLVCTTDPVTPWAIMRGQLRFLSKHGFDVLLVSAPGPLLDATSEREGVRVRPVQMEREIDPAADARSLVQLVKLYRSERPDISLVSTPKAGLLAGLAAFCTRVPRRIYMLRGLRLETVSGAKRWLLWVLEWVALHLAHDVIVVSPSLLARARKMHLLGRQRGTVLGRGASNGVDLERFESSPRQLAAAADIRANLGIPTGSFVFGFVGRLTLDKGIAELVRAFEQLAKTLPDVWLLMVTGHEPKGLPRDLTAALANGGRIRFTGWLDDTAPAYRAMDCLVLPTYREGFPNVPLEAAASAKPVITTTAVGAIDSIDRNRSGVLVQPRCSTSLRDAMQNMAQHRSAALSMGQHGKQFVETNFSNATVWRQLTDYLHPYATSRTSETPSRTSS